MAQPLHRAVSGMRPTGPLHLGHYFGALKNWTAMQDRMETYFFVADWHALTSDYAEPGRIKEYSTIMIIDWIAAGLNPEKSVLFQQSKVPAHAELNLILSMITPLSWLERNPTYKEQQQEITTKDLGNYGFLGYPVLQAADILLYRPRWVPVGQDQLPHLELTREIARRFNHLYGDYLPEPEAHLTEAAKCPGLDGRKMSKSYGNGIFLSERIEEIAPKVRGMFTDKNRLRKTDPGNPEICNLYPYHDLLTDTATREEIRTGCTTATMGCVDCKTIFLRNLESFLKPLNERRAAFLARPDAVADILAEGNRRAAVEAEKTMAGILKKLNF